MSRMSRMSIVLPFAGFYYSLWDHETDHELERLAEWEVEENQQGEYAGRDMIELRAAMQLHCYWTITHRRIAESYSLELGAELDTMLGVPTGIAFHDLDSPREYNFATDRVFAWIDSEAARTMLARVDSERLEVIVAERHSSRSGFISYYTNDVADWLAEPIEKWDHNMLGTLLIAFLETEGEDVESLEMSMFERMSGNGVIGDAVSAAIDWNKVSRDMNQEVEA